MPAQNKSHFYGRADKEDMNADPIELKTQLYQCLEETRGKWLGSFAHGQTLATAPNPGLVVHGLGTIGLPLSEREAVELKKACHQAPFGKGSEPLVDTKVRDTWELNADQFVLRNRSWQATLDQVLQRVAQALGVAGGSTAIKAELYKLLLYDEGAFFDSYTDTEKVPGMIGTLVIALPSKHTGGDVQTSFGGRKLTLSTAESSDFGYSYVAWYSDVEHAVRPVISGHRLVLTYNLIQVGSGPRQAASNLNDDQATLVRTLALWNGPSSQDLKQSPNSLAYMLDHKYTDANLRSDYLKGKDAQQFRDLQAACENLDIDLLLANVEYTKGGSCEERYDPYDHYGGRRGYNWKSDDDDDDDDGSAESDEGSGYGSEIGNYHELAEVFDNSLRLRTFYRANGQLLALDIDIEAENIVQDDTFDRAPDKEDYEGYTGNAGASATHFYRNSCIVIMPRQNMVPFLLEHAKNGFVSIDDWLGPMIEEVKDNPRDERRRTELTHVCQLLLTASINSTKERPGIFRHSSSSSSFSDHSLGVVARAALQVRNQTLFDIASRASKECLPIEIDPAFAETLNNTELVQWCQSLILALGRVSKVHLRWEAVKKTLKARNALSLPVSDADALGNLLRQPIENILSLEVTTCKPDAQAIIDMIQAYGPAFLFTNILPFVKKHVTNTTFTINFLVLLFRADNMGTFKEGLSRNIYRDVLADLVPSLKVESDLRTQKRPKYEHYYVGGRTSEQTDVDFIEPIEVADLLDHCRTMSLAEEREALMDQLVVASKWADPSAFGKMFIPLLKRMVELSQSANLSLTNTIPRPFFKSIIDAYVLRYVRPEPEKPRDWAQARTGCRNGCGDCSQLNSFLTNPQERTRGFAMAEKRRRHLANQLSYSGCTLDTVHRGIPYTLVVTKTEKKWHEHHKAWRERCRVAGKSFISLGIEALQKILGEDYERAVDLKSRKAGSAADRKPGAAVETPARSLTRKTPVSTMNQPVPFPTAILAKAQQAARRSPLGAVTQSLAPSTNVLPNKPRRSVSKVEIIDLTIE